MYNHLLYSNTQCEKPRRHLLLMRDIVQDVGMMYS